MEIFKKEYSLDLIVISLITFFTFLKEVTVNETLVELPLKINTKNENSVKVEIKYEN